MRGWSAKMNHMFHAEQRCAVRGVAGRFRSTSHARYLWVHYQPRSCMKWHDVPFYAFTIWLAMMAIIQWLSAGQQIQWFIQNQCNEGNDDAHHHLIVKSSCRRIDRWVDGSMGRWVDGLVDGSSSTGCMVRGRGRCISPHVQRRDVPTLDVSPRFCSAWQLSPWYSAGLPGTDFVTEVTLVFFRRLHGWEI